MSILSGLPHYGLDRHGSIVTVDTGQPGALLAAVDVREALRHPTDEQVYALIDVAKQHGNIETAVRTVLAAAAGGDQ